MNSAGRLLKVTLMILGAMLASILIFGTIMTIVDPNPKPEPSSTPAPTPAPTPAILAQVNTDHFMPDAHPIRDVSRLGLQAIINLPIGAKMAIIWKDQKTEIETTNLLFKHPSTAKGAKLVLRGEACEVANGTSLDLLEIGDDGAVVRVVAGPQTGCSGFVPSYSLDLSRTLPPDRNTH